MNQNLITDRFSSYLSQNGKPLRKISSWRFFRLSDGSDSITNAPMEMFIKKTMPRDKRNQNSGLFFRQTMRYLVVCNFGYLIQSLDCIQLLSAIQCLECASMTHHRDMNRNSYPGQLKLASPFSPAYQHPHCL
jgi:hypothetical protein